MIIQYFIGALTTYHPVHTKLDFEALGKICIFVPTSNVGAKLIVTDERNPMLGMFNTLGRLIPVANGLPLRLKEVFYFTLVIGDGHAKTIPFRHRFHGHAFLTQDMKLSSTDGPLFRREKLTLVSGELHPITPPGDHHMIQFTA